VLTRALATSPDFPNRSFDEAHVAVKPSSRSGFEVAARFVGKSSLHGK